jgi:hypothetical protein
MRTFRSARRWTIGAAAMMSAVTATAASAAERLALSVVSSPRPDLVSDGDALIQVTGARGQPLAFLVNGAPAQVRIRQADPSRTLALIEGLRPGENEIAVQANRSKARLKVVNHDKDGPILSGPHLTPYECRTVEAGLGPAIDKNCNIKTRYDWFYRSTDKTFKPLPPGARPADLATTTTIDGRTAPYIVRVEAGTINRTIYKIAILDDPSNASGPDWRPGQAWNGRLAASFGYGTGNKYHQGTLDPKDGVDVFNDRFLSRGFAHLVASEFVNNVHSNPVLQGEALMMLKEHFIEQYGPPRWTTGFGGSGGSVAQQGIAQIYPGLLDGILPSASFPDNTVFPVAQCVLVKGAIKRSGRTLSLQQQQAIEGHYPGMCDTLAAFGALYSATFPVMCELKDASLVYDPKRNPKGARCGLHETLANIVGRDPATGFRLRFEDNVGVQYGLLGLNDGRLSVDEFLDVNDKVGGFNVDGAWQAARMAGDPAAIRRAYESGIVNSGGGGLFVTPIVQYRSYSDHLKDLHDRYRDLVLRERLIRTNGDATNHVIWMNTLNTKMDIDDLALDAITRWLDAITADPEPLSHAKIARLRPADVTDAYWDAQAVKHPATANWDPTTPMNTLMPFHTDPLIQAGGPKTGDVLKCRLKAIDFRAYKAAFSAEQQARMRSIFPEGVCDYSKPGVGQVPLKGVYQAY